MQQQQQQRYPYCQLVNATVANCTSSVPINTFRKSEVEKISSCEDSVSFQVDYDFGNETFTMPPSMVEDSSKIDTSVASTMESMKSLELGRTQQTRRSKGLYSIRKNPPPSQPVMVENEQLLTSTLEELGDAVAW